MTVESNKPVQVENSLFPAVGLLVMGMFICLSGYMFLGVPAEYVRVRPAIVAYFLMTIGVVVFLLGLTRLGYRLCIRDIEAKRTITKE